MILSVFVCKSIGYCLSHRHKGLAWICLSLVWRRKASNQKQQRYVFHTLTHIAAWVCSASLCGLNVRIIIKGYCLVNLSDMLARLCMNQNWQGHSLVLRLVILWLSLSFDHNNSNMFRLFYESIDYVRNFHNDNSWFLILQFELVTRGAYDHID